MAISVVAVLTILPIAAGALYTANNIINKIANKHFGDSKFTEYHNMFTEGVKDLMKLSKDVEEEVKIAKEEIIEVVTDVQDNISETEEAIKDLSDGVHSDSIEG